MTDTTQIRTRLATANLPQVIVDSITEAHEQITQLAQAVSVSDVNINKLASTLFDAAKVMRGLKERADHPLLVAQAAQAESGHISIEVGTTAKGDPTYSVKIVVPITPGATGAADDALAARLIAQQQLEAAAAFLAARYSQTAAPK